MNAGTIAVLDDPVADPIETASQSGSLPALEVEEEQSRLDGSGAIQTGIAAAEVPATKTHVSLGRGGSIFPDTTETTETAVTEWVADVTDGGFVVAASVREDGSYPFPFDLFSAQTGADVEAVVIDVDALAHEWRDGGEALRDTWMVGSGDDFATSIDYGAAATFGPDSRADIGLGFELAWNGTVAKGVVYQSGYLAIWEDWTTAQFARFVESELLPHAEVPEDDEFEQETLGGEGASA